MTYTVDAVQEALSVLMHVAQAPGLGVTELGKRSGNTKARTFRLLSTLEQNGFVQRSADGTSYILGHMSLVLGMAAQEQVSIARVAKKHLDELGERFNENFHVRVRDGLQSLSIVKWDSTRSVRVHSEVGERRPLHAGATGKVLLAFAADDVQSLVLGAPLERFTATTPTQRTKLARELARIKAEGVAVSHGEIVPDVVALGVPVFDAGGGVIAALGISMPTSRAPQDLTPYVSALREAARSISWELGWRGAT
jgi:IclR family transcriptional regulator, KDG regulon repressor